MSMDVTDALHADVYVRVSLLQQNKVVKTKRTDVVRRSVSPSFNESFTFRMPHSPPQRYQTDSAPGPVTCCPWCVVQLQNAAVRCRRLQRQYYRPPASQQPDERSVVRKSSSMSLVSQQVAR